MIRQKLHQNILSTIQDHKKFDNIDIEITTKPDRNSTLLSLVYIIEPKYYIKFHIPNSPSSDKDSYGSYYLFSGSVCPGPMSYTETFSFKIDSEIYNRISKWLDCIWEELSSNPVVKQIEKQQQQINEIFEKFDTLSDEGFSITEVQDIKDRLDALELSLKEQIESSINDKKAYEAEISKLQNDIEILKQTTSSLSKKGWVRSFVTKAFKWTSNSENRKALKDGYTLIKEFLPDNITDSLPN